MSPLISRVNFYPLINWAASSEFVSSSIPSWQILTALAQPFRWARDLAFYLKVPLDSLLVWASSGGSGETARIRRLAWTFAARIGDKGQIRLTQPKLNILALELHGPICLTWSYCQYFKYFNGKLGIIQFKLQFLLVLFKDKLSRISRKL